jgi:hypothetical protein
MGKSRFGLALTFVFAASCVAAAQGDVGDSRTIPPRSKVFIAPMNGFETYLVAAFTTKKVPLTVVADRDQADFEIVGVSDSQKPGWVRTLVKGDTGTDEQASIAVKNLHSGVLAFGYAVNLKDSFRGKQSAAESCAKHLKDKIEQDAKTMPTQPLIVAVASTVTETPAASQRAPLRRSVAALIQADWSDDEFVAQLKSAFAAEGIDVQAVERGTPYDFNIILTTDKTSTGPAAAVAVLDANGKLLVSAARGGFRSKGAARGAAEEAAKKLAATLR